MSANTKDKSNKGSWTYDLYLGHVPKSIQEAALVEVFSKYGNVVDVLIRHSTGTFGYAIVKFKHKKDAEKVLRQVKTITIDSYEMEVKHGKRSTQGVDNVNGSSSKTVTFAEPCLAIQHADGNIYLTETPVSINDFHCPVYTACENALVPVTIEIMCTNVEDAITFHGCTITSYEELTRLSIKLNSICPNLQRLMRKPIINRIYGGLYSADCQWYRCRVLQYGPGANSSLCIVEYIDYGNVAEVCYTDMVELPEPLKNTSPFAIKCAFTNLVPTVKSLNCASYLHHLVNHRMSLCALHSWGSLEYLVTKCTCNGIDVITELVRNGYAVYKTQECLKNTSPKMDKASKIQETKKLKKVSDSHKKKSASSCNGTAKHSHEAKNGGIMILEKSDKSSSSAESPDFIPKKIIKRGNDTASDNNPILESKAVNHLLKVDSVISCVKVINNIRSLIPLHSYDDLISEAVDLLRSEMNIAVSDDKKQLVENAKKAYSEALKEIRECSDMNLLSELKEKRNQKRIELCSELEQYLKSFDSTLLEKRKKIQETITALESNSTAWLNVYLAKIPETIEDLLVAFNEEKERKRKNIEMARKNTDEKHEKFLKVYADLGNEFSLNMVNRVTDDGYVVNNIGKKGSWALKFDEALTEFGIALEEERNISTVMEDRSYVSVIQCILEKLDIPKERIDAECDVYEKYKSLYDSLNSLDLNPIFAELHEVSKVINSFTCCSNDTDAEKLSDRHVSLHLALLREDALLGAVVRASAQHFPELIAEHPELRLEDYQKNFCLLKFSWHVCFFPPVGKCNRIEPSYVSNFGDESVVIKEFNVGYDYEKAFIKRVKIWNEIKSTALVKIRGLFKNTHDSSRCDETSCRRNVKLSNGDVNHETQTKTPGKVIHDENQNTLTNMNSESRDVIEINCNWTDCGIELMAHDELILHVFEDHVGKNDKSLICQWKDCSTKGKPFKSQESLILHMRKHIGEKALIQTTRNVIYAVLPATWETLYDKPLPIPVDYKVALNVLQQVLEGLCNIHSRGIIHGAIHPMSILHKEGKVLLDFNFDKQLLKDKLCVNGINFQVPKEDFKSADMYGFGCLVLWVLFPNLSFQSTDDSVPNITAFQSIIQNMLIPKDFASLSALLNVNCNIRPTSRMLRSNGFLKELSIMTESSSFVMLDLAQI